MRSIKELKNIKGKRIIVRVDFNLSIEDGKIEDDFRIKKTLPLIKFLISKKAKIILISHIGGGKESLAPVAKRLNKFIKAKFIPQVLGRKVEKVISLMRDSDVVLLENLRSEKGEKEGSKLFAIELSKLGDIYVNEAFPVSHREDASIVLLPKILPAYAGIQFEQEIKNLSRVFKKPKRPFLFIIGGAKFSTKIPLIKKFLKLADNIFIGGALLNDFLEAKGYEVGKSLVDDEIEGLRKIAKSKKVILPEYVKTRSGSTIQEEKISEVDKKEMILDLGDKSITKLTPFIAKARLILWNGPLGKYEDGGDKATKKILKLIANSKAESIIGGGDTVALISQMGLESEFTFVSTGGGAMLEFLSKGTLPGIKALLR